MIRVAGLSEVVDDRDGGHAPCGIAACLPPLLAVSAQLAGKLIEEGLPLVENEKIVDPDYIWRAYDEPSFPIDGTWDSDARICLRASAPRACTVLGIVMGIESHDKN